MTKLTKEQLLFAKGIGATHRYAGLYWQIDEDGNAWRWHLATNMWVTSPKHGDSPVRYSIKIDFSPLDDKPPSVGTKCRSKCPSGHVVSGTIVYHKADGVTALFLSDDMVTVFWQTEFLPLETERDKWVNNVCERLKCDEYSEITARTIASQIYDHVIKGTDGK